MKNKIIISFSTAVLFCFVFSFINYDRVQPDGGTPFLILISIIIIVTHTLVSQLLLFKLDKLWIVFAYNLSFLISAFVLDEFEFFYLYFYLIFFLLKILFWQDTSESDSFEILDD